MNRFNRVRLLVLASVVLTCAALSTSNAFALGETPCGSTEDGDGDCITTAFEDQLIGRFAPLLRLYPNESFRPSSVEFQLAGSLLSHGSCGTLVARGSITAANLLSQSCAGQSSGLSAGQTGFVLNASSATLNGSVSTARCYAHVSKSAVANAAFDVQYWFNYPKNGDVIFGIGQHNGDWEHVTVRVAANGTTVNSVFFARHGNNNAAQTRTPGDGRLAFVAGTTRPIVYSARNGHASYPSVGNTEFPDITLNGGPTVDCAAAGKSVNTGEKGSALNGQTWLNYSGVWGSGSNAPSGPAYHGDWFASAKQ